MSKEAENELNVFSIKEKKAAKPQINEILQLLEVRYDRLGIDVSSLPFSLSDTTAGSEAELQTAVKGKAHDVDLPRMIEESNYYANTRRRARAGDAPKKALDKLDDYLQKNSAGIWENSWVSFPQTELSAYTMSILEKDLLLDKAYPEKGRRTDLDRFLFRKDGQDFIRVPISYLLKLALAEIIGPPDIAHTIMRIAGVNIMQYFLNDNTSPEISSFYVSTMPSDKGIGDSAAQEMSARFLLTQILIMYANKKFMLSESGQEAIIYYSPHPPIRQKALNSCISDAFYRELFMNPCLSGWAKGEDKYEYMHLCHRVLSRSQFNAVLKLREAGIITSNLVALPNLSNMSLANNGTHVSLGSNKLTRLLQNTSSGYSKYHEKYLGDLVVKITEHFLPLFVGTYSAAPYRMGFKDFHPEKALGFLPHELDFTHLRMIWRRWKKKANLNILGSSITPFGPEWLDDIISAVFRLKGDFIPDFRLVDYLVALLSTEKSPSLDGQLDNSQKLKHDLENMGVFDRKMSLYLFDKLREYDVMGFSGFEGRHYSLFESFADDMGSAINLQNFIYLLAFKYIAAGQVTHEHIPDEPFIESERRQIIFGTAIGIPTFFVYKKTTNTFLLRIIENTERVRSSRRYPGYYRVYNNEYRKALLKIIKKDAADLIQMMEMKDTINDLLCRLDKPDCSSVAGKLTRGVLDAAGARSAMSLKADKFNEAAEKYYREDLRKKQIHESFTLFKNNIININKAPGIVLQELNNILNNNDIRNFMEIAEKEVINEEISIKLLEKLIRIMLLCTYSNSILNQKNERAWPLDVVNEASIH